MRSIWTGSLSFGLVNVPVRLYSATQEHEISFDLLHKTDFSPIRYAKICKAEEKEVPYKDIVKGYEYEKGRYIVLEDKDFERVNQKKSKLIEIQAFTYESEVDAVYFDKPYFLEPDKGAAKAYAILREALKRSEKVGIATFVMRNREHLAIVKPYHDAIVLNILRYESEIRSIKDLDLPESAKGTAKEVEMAVKLIDQLTESFKPENFKSTYTEDLKKVIDEKIKGKGPHPKVSEPKMTKVTDIMSTLKASLQEFKPHAKSKVVRKSRTPRTKASKSKK
jgi:DNA end-binding protein Ku